LFISGFSSGRGYSAKPPTLPKWQKVLAKGGFEIDKTNPTLPEWQ